MSSSSSDNPDSAYYLDEKEADNFRRLMPWKSDPNYFQNVKISAVALLKLVMHACRGGDHEVMGILQGKSEPRTFYILDAFALPVEGTETRVSAGDSATEYHDLYHITDEQIGRNMPDAGWYHSHPGYTCWMSGIDVQTQSICQYLDPYLAIVIDPKSTMTSGHVDIGAFRTYPQGYKPQTTDRYQTIPKNKVKDWGVHADRYYKLKITFFHSETDKRVLAAMQQKLWVTTVSTTSFLANQKYYTQQIQDFVTKLEENYNRYLGPDVKRALGQDSQKILSEQAVALATHVVKHAIFTPSS